MSSRKTSNRQAGFAILEAVIVMTISALIFVALAVSSGMVVRHAKAMNERTNRAEALIGGLEAWRLDVASAFIPGHAGDGPSLTGSATTMRFVAARSGLDGIAEQIDYSVLGPAVMRSSTPYRPVAFGEKPATSTAPLLNGPWTFRFAYRARHGSVEWLSDWSAVNELPAFVMLTIVTADTAAAPVAEIVAPIRANRVGPCLETCAAADETAGDG